MYFLITLLCLSCQSTEIVLNNCTIHAIDSTSFKAYYHITVTQDKDIFHLLSKKGKISTERETVPLKIGQLCTIKVEKVNDIETRNGAVIRVGSTGFYVDGVKLLDPGETFYSSPCLVGITLKRNCED